MVRLLLDLGAAINAPPSPGRGRTALQAACCTEGGAVPDLVRMLLARGADVNAPACRNMGFTALQAACLGGETELVHLLLFEAGAEVNAPGSTLHGGTALHAAVAGGHIDLVRKLLAAGADPNSVSGSRRQTPLQSAYIVDRSDIMDVLVEAGAIGPRAGGRLLFGIQRTKFWSRDE